MGFQIISLVFSLSVQALGDDDGKPPGSMRRVLIMTASMMLQISVVIFIFNTSNRHLEYQKRNSTMKIFNSLTFYELDAHLKMYIMSIYAVNIDIAPMNKQMIMIIIMYGILLNTLYCFY
jgi:hypothetical protein